MPVVSFLLLAFHGTRNGIRPRRCRSERHRSDDTHAGVGRQQWRRIYRVLDAEARDMNGKTIGEVHDILINSLGKVTALEIEAGGVLEIGDRHFRVPWHEARIAADARSVTVPAPVRGNEKVLLHAGE